MNKLLTHKTTKLSLISLSILGIIGVSFPFGLIVNPVLAQSEVNSIEAKKAEADRLFDEGDKLFEEGTAESLQEAIIKFERALALYQEIGDKSNEALTNLGSGRSHDLLGFKQEALTLYNQALHLSQEIGNPSAEGVTLNNIGLVYQSLGEYPKALQYFEDALAIFKEIGDRLMEDVILNNIGLVYHSLGEYPKALQYYEDALAITQEIGDKNGELLAFIGIGAVYHSLGEYPKALQYFEDALAITQEIGDRLGEGSTLNNIGEVYRNLAQYSQALPYYKQSLAISKEIGDRPGESTTLNNIALVYHSLGEYPQALQYYENALAISQEIRDLSREDATLNNIGEVYRNLGQYSKALQYFEDALAISQEIGDRLGEGSTLNNIGGIYDTLGQYSKALQYYEEALAIRKEIGDRSGEGSTLNNIGGIYDSLGQYPKALQYYEDALAIFKEIGDRSGEGSTLGNIGGIYDSLGQYSKALQYFEDALAIFKEIGDRSREGTTLSNIGFILAQQNNFSEAEKYLCDSIEINESINSKDLEDSNKISLFNTYVNDYLILQKVLIQQNKTLSALEVAERGRAAALKEELAKRLSTPEAPVTVEKPTIEQIRQTAKNHNATLVQYSIIRDIFDVNGKKEAQDSELYIWVIKPTGEIDFRSYNLKENNIDLNQLVEQARTAIRWSKGKLNRANNNNNQTTLKPDDFAKGDLLYFQGEQIGSTPWEVIAINPQNNTLTVNNLGWDNPEPKEKPISQVEYKTDIALKQLHKILIDTIADLLPTDPDQKVIFIPQGALFLLPFPALLDEDYTYLIQKHTILTAPAIQVLDSTYQKRQNIPTIYETPLKPQETLIVGNPSPMPSKTLQPLENAEKEAQTIANLFKTQPIIKNDATESNIVSKISDARLIHFATHGLFNQNRAISSYIAFAPDPNFSKTSDNDNLIFPNNNDGFLIAEEIFDLKLNADLVVLSACNTGQGEITGDGVIGLSRAFISAGTSSLMVSLWAVADEETANLMIQFYQNMTQMPDKAQALREAMLTTMETNPDPYYWAAFTLIGESE